MGLHPTGTRWPSPCDPRPAWWGVGGNYEQSPAPRKCRGWWLGMNPNDPDFPVPDWWPGVPVTESGPVFGWEANADYFVGPDSGWDPMFSPDEAMTVKFRDRKFDGGPVWQTRWFRVFTGSVVHEPTGEWIICDPDPAIITEVTNFTNWQPTPYDFWGRGFAARFITWGHAIDWEVDGWVSPIGREPIDNVLVGSWNLTSKPSDWEGPIVP